MPILPPVGVTINNNYIYIVDSDDDKVFVYKNKEYVSDQTNEWDAVTVSRLDSDDDSDPIDIHVTISADNE